MARKKKDPAKMTEAELAQASLDHFEWEKREYEKRTGEKVQFVPATPIALMPSEEVESGESRVESEDSEETGEAQGDE